MDINKENHTPEERQKSSNATQTDQQNDHRAEYADSLDDAVKSEHSRCNYCEHPFFRTAQKLTRV